MKNEKLYKKLENNYKKEITDYLQFLKQKGFILTIVGDSIQIWKYNARLNDFTMGHTVEGFINVINENVKNYFDIVLTGEKYIELIKKSLPFVSGDDIDKFKAYNEAICHIKSDSLLKDDLKTLNQELKQKQRPIMKNAPDEVIEQIQALTNDNIVFCLYSDGHLLKKKGLFRFNKKTEVFDRLTVTEISIVLDSAFGVPFDEKTVEKHLKSFHKCLLNSTLPDRWNKNQKYKFIIDNYKNKNLDGSLWK